MPTEDYSDIEAYLRPYGQTARLGSLHPKLDRFLKENGVPRPLSMDDPLGVALVKEFIEAHNSGDSEDPRTGHDRRNLIWRLGAPLFARRGWRV